MADVIEHPAYKIARDFIQLVTLMFCFYTANVGSRNNEKIEVVEKKQNEVVIKQDEAAKKADEVKETLESKMDDDIKTTGVQLYSSWKYLDDVANTTGKMGDVIKAEEAKKLYQYHLKKYDGVKGSRPK